MKRNLLFLFVLALFPVFCWGTDIVQDGITYTTTGNANEVSIVGWKGNNANFSQSIITIPSIVSESYYVTLIDGFMYTGTPNTVLTTLVINVASGKTITIKADAFRECTSLTSVVINGNAIVESGAFYSCSSLSSVIVNGSLTINNNGGFDKCTNLKCVYNIRYGKWLAYRCRSNPYNACSGDRCSYFCSRNNVLLGNFLFSGSYNRAKRSHCLHYYCSNQCYNG